MGPASAPHARPGRVLCNSNRGAPGRRLLRHRRAGQNVDMSSSWSPAAQAGARYAFDRNRSMVMLLGLNWRQIDITLSDATGTPKATLEFRPVVVGLAVGSSV